MGTSKPKDLGSESEVRLDANLDDAKRLTLALAAGRTGVWNWNASRGTVELDRRVAHIWGLPNTKPVETDRLIGLFHADDREAALSGLLTMEVEDGIGETDTGDEDLEFRIRRFDDGRERWIAVRGRVFRDDADRVVEIIGTARDITDHKLHDIHLHMLLREITHRSKNLLAIIQAMARQTVKDSLSAAEFEQRLSNRLRGLAASHELLAAQDWHGAHLEELVKGQLSHILENYPSRVATRGPSVFVKPEAAQNIGLALNELATNAVRFGALSNDLGTVEVGWSLDDPSVDQRRLSLTWNEFGGPAVAPPRRQGFGQKVVERVAARALDGSVSLSFAPTGLQWSLRIPMSFVMMGQPAALEGMPQFF